jgi:hypothetical protein
MHSLADNLKLSLISEWKDEIVTILNEQEDCLKQALGHEKLLVKP